jgi:hypothetical protein
MGFAVIMDEFNLTSLPIQFLLFGHGKNEEIVKILAVRRKRAQQDLAVRIPLMSQCVHKQVAFFFSADG